MGANGLTVRGTASSTGAWLAARARAARFACTRPLGYLAFVIALAALSASARLLGEDHELGYFAGRLNRMISRYPEVTRPGVQMAWLCWFVLLGVALSPIDPIASRWDEVVLVAFAAGVLWRRVFVARASGH